MGTVLLYTWRYDALYIFMCRYIHQCIHIFLIYWTHNQICYSSYLSFKICCFRNIALSIVWYSFSLLSKSFMLYSWFGTSLTLKRLAIYQQLWSVLPLFAKFYVIISLFSYSKSIPQKSNHDFKENILMFQWVQSNPCALKTFWQKHLFFCCSPHVE